MTNDNGIIVANAPVSYGAFEVTIGFDPNVPDGDDILDQVSAAGYGGIDLGPVGYLGTTEDLGAKLAKRGLGLAGAYLELPYADPELLEKTLPELDAMLDIFDSIKSLTRSFTRPVTRVDGRLHGLQRRAPLGAPREPQ